MTGRFRAISVALMVTALPALAAPPVVSPVPTLRPERDAAAAAVAEATPPPSRSNVVIEVIEVMALAALDAADGAAHAEGPVAADIVAPPPGSLAIAASRRPTPRGDVPEDFSARAALLHQATQAAEDAAGEASRPPRTSDPEFRSWIAEFQTRARALGITQATLDAAFDGVQIDADVLRLDRNQAEFSRTLWDYLDTAVSPSRIRNGRAARAEWSTTLGRIEDQYQVEAEVVVAVWGLETSYGAMRGGTNVIEAMASLAFDGRRQDFFEEQLIAALRIVQSGDTAPRNMIGSWAGAMGHTQFMPTSYLEFAQDFNGDGRRDIWSDAPVDALASTANYLAENGWTYGQPWGLEVRLPDGFDYRLAGEQERISAPFWNSQGVRLVNGDEVPDHGPASILLPGGAQGVALVVYNNFRVIERYNPADAYVIAIGLLSDRISDGPAFRGSWPRGDRALSFTEREELQRRLLAAGHFSDRIDGIIGPITIAAVRSYQDAVGLTPDGYASLRLLERLRNG